LESKFRKLEEKVAKYTAKVDSIESRLVVLESKVEEAKNEESPPRKQKGGGKHKYKIKTDKDVVKEA
jgi:hypothetical protein